MKNEVDLQCNKVFHLEDSVIMYGTYNSDTLETLIDTVHRLHNQTTWKEQLFAGMYERFINQLRIYSKAIRILSKGYLPISLLLPTKLNKILQEV